jgi:tetratricopeptide (TPR) repeat protein
LAAARRHYAAALAIYPGIGARLGEANVQKALGDLALREGHRDEALDLLGAALTTYRAIGARLGEAGTYMMLGRATDDVAHFERALALHAEIESAYDVAVDSYYYGLSQRKLGDPQKAASLLSQARDIWRQIGLPAYAQIAQNELDGLGK